MQIRFHHRNYHLCVIRNKQIGKIFSYEKENKTYEHPICTADHICRTKSFSNTIQLTCSDILRIVCRHGSSNCYKGLGKNTLNLGTGCKCSHCIGAQDIQGALHHHGADRCDGKLKTHGNSHADLFSCNIFVKMPVLSLHLKLRHCLPDVNQAKQPGHALRDDGSPGSSRCTPVEKDNKYKIKHNVKHGRQDQEIKRRLTISQCPQNT